jgi:pimeloyl-ACP methyl ester carboxylesterase
VFPPHIDSALENPTTFLDSYQAVVDACGREPACAAGGDLGARIREVVLAYDADPVQVEVQDYLSGVSDDVYADGETIVGVVTQALYSPLWFTDLPELVAELEAGETGALEQFLSQQRTNEPFFSTGMFYAFECNEEVVFADRDEVAAAVPPDPFGLFETFEYASNSGTFAFDTCEAFGTVAAPPESNEAVTSDIPTLLMAGAFDPVTPVSWAEAAAETLPNSFTVVAPTEAHGVSPGRCGMGVMRQFLDDPATEPDASCYAGGALQFLGVPDEEIVLEPVTLEYPASGVTISTVRPEDWDHGQLPGDSYRQASFLDVTQIVQVVGDSSLSFGLEIYLSDTWGIEVSEATERPGLHGRDWQYRSGQSDQAAVEWYETEIDGSPTFVVLVSSPQELEHHIDTVLDPVLESIDVE